jgi:hypothetical protein
LRHDQDRTLENAESVFESGDNSADAWILLKPEVIKWVA